MNITIKYSYFVLFFYVIVHICLLPVLAVSSWTQTDWSGGSGQTLWSNSSQFSTQTNIDILPAGQITLSSNAPSDWYDATWRYRKKFSIDPSNIPGTDPLTNFPLLINLTSDTDLAAKAQDSGADILFTTDDGITIAHYEVQQFNGTTGALHAWISVPTVSAISPTDVYMYYGNADPTPTIANTPESIWNNYKLVLHMDEQSGQFADSTTNNNDTTAATVESRDSTGKINGSIEMSQTNGQLFIPNNANNSLDAVTDFTISLWINATSGIGDNFKMLIMKSADSSPRNYALYLNFDFPYLSWENSGFQQQHSSTALIFDEWHLLTYRRTGSLGTSNLTEQFYIDGVLVHNVIDTDPRSTLITDDEDMYIGSQPSGYHFAGLMDEVRISNSPFTQEYIQAEFTNQDNPVNFYSIDSEEEYIAVYETSGNLVSSIYDNSGSFPWGELQASINLPTFTSAQIKIRTGNNSALTDATDFSLCPQVTIGTDISSSGCVNDSHRYIQYQMLLQTSDTSVSPTIQDISISYEGNNSNSSENTAPVTYLPNYCGESLPSGIPDLFQIKRTPNSVDLFFTPVFGNKTGYHVLYGYQVGDERFGSLSEPLINNGMGVQKITIGNLNPDVEYWFKIITANGCATGQWSNWLHAPITKDQSTMSYKYLP